MLMMNSGPQLPCKHIPEVLAGALLLYSPTLVNVWHVAGAQECPIPWVKWFSMELCFD